MGLSLLFGLVSTFAIMGTGFGCHETSTPPSPATIHRGVAGVGRAICDAEMETCVEVEGFHRATSLVGVGVGALEDFPVSRVIGTDLQDPQWGMSGIASNRQPHPACDLCFTVPASGNPYQIYEYVEGDGPEAVILPRRIPNPAPSPISRPTMTSDGEPIYYIGTQAIIGPTDEEIWSEYIPIPYIELKRIQVRHMNTLWAIPGVHGMGIGADGFVVKLLPDHEDSRALIPDHLEGVPVSIKISGYSVPFAGGGKQ